VTERLALSCAALAWCALSACASLTPPHAQGAQVLSGRLSVRVETEPVRALSGAFELSGTAQNGALVLTSPLGSTLAQARWSPGEAVLETPGSRARYPDLDTLAEQALGERVPLAALFDWLRGRPWSGAPSEALPDGGPGFSQLGWRVGLGNSTVNLVFVHVVYGLGFTTLFFRNYYEAFPTELVKAAQVDGASFFQIFRRIMLPNSLPIIVVTVIYQFTNIWNDFLFASAYAGTGDSMPMTVALNNVVNTSTGERPYNVHMAAAMIAALPTLLVYIFGGRYFVRGLMAGSVKG